jgi:hypothetical protein
VKGGLAAAGPRNRHRRGACALFAAVSRFRGLPFSAQQRRKFKTPTTDKNGKTASFP